jgi:hypothetical protein
MPGVAWVSRCGGRWGRLPVLLVTGAIGAGCTALRVDPLGNGLYGVVGRDDRSVLDAQRVAVRRADEFCAGRGGRAEVFTSANRSYPVVPQPTYELVFTCALADPPGAAEGVTPEAAIARLRAVRP